MRTLDRSRLENQLKVEEQRFLNEHPKSKALFEQARQHWQGGVPMLWMVRWAGNFPVFVTEAQGRPLPVRRWLRLHRLLPGRHRAR